jgi:hypothetical protein
MKILIITTRRSGGTTLGTWLSTETGLEYVYEPDITDDFIKDNTVVKLIYQIDHDQQIRDLAKSYDKIIVHKRCDVEKQAESLAVSQITNVHHKPYPISPSFFSKHKELCNDLCKIKAEKNKGLDCLDFGIHTEYERIFLNVYGRSSLLEYLEIPRPKYLDLLDSKYKYRNDIGSKLI